MGTTIKQQKKSAAPLRFCEKSASSVYPTASTTSYKINIKEVS